ncbi:SOS response-associated peptidase [Acidovorax sp. LjRoot129]|uniref:SOS response-associated peptidase n=1 Tax=Acidovorax sp. LjRoot129 TaxID=3342260 RepID=UPI003ECE78C6
MCTRYISPNESAAEREWRIDARNHGRIFNKVLLPGGRGLFIRCPKGAASGREMLAGRWGLIPAFSDKADHRYSTSNARSEELSRKASFKGPWRQSQRCIIPALEFIEPNWESGHHVPWAFKRADGGLWGLAGIWSTWIDPRTGDEHESYSMLTKHANSHQLMSRMHKPEMDKATKRPLPPEQQDKRSVIPIEQGDVDTWLAGTVDEALGLLRLSPAEAFDAGPEAGYTLIQPSLF